MTLVLLVSLNPYAPATHPLLLVIPTMVSDMVGFSMFPSFLLVNVTLVCPLTTLYPCVQKYPVRYIFHLY